MATPKKAPQPTWAEKYAKAKADEFEQFLEASFSESALKDVQLYEVPVGALRFKCRTLDAAFMAATGMMPTMLTEEVMNAEAADLASDPEFAAEVQDKLNEATPDERFARMQAADRVIRYICVEPRVIAGDIGNHRNAIPSVTLSDAKTLVSWASGAGGEAARVKAFRQKRK